MVGVFPGVLQLEIIPLDDQKVTVEVDLDN